MLLFMDTTVRNFQTSASAPGSSIKHCWCHHNCPLVTCINCTSLYGHNHDKFSNIGLSTKLIPGNSFKQCWWHNNCSLVTCINCTSLYRHNCEKISNIGLGTKLILSSSIKHCWCHNSTLIISTGYLHNLYFSLMTQLRENFKHWPQHRAHPWQLF